MSSIFANCKKESKSQEINRLGEKCFHSHIPLNWIACSHAQADFGYDYWIHLKDIINNQIKSAFLVQLKTKAKAVKKDGYISVRISAENLNYYNKIACPLMLVFCDLQGYKHNPENAALYYCWYQNIELLPYKKSYLIKIPIRNKLTRRLNLNDEIEKFIYNFQSFITSQKYKRDYYPKKYSHYEVISGNTCTFSTIHIRLQAFLPTIKSIDSGSCLITFALLGSDDCMMSFNHKTILYDLFCGSLNQDFSLNRKFIVCEKWDDENIFFVQLGNCRYMLQKEHVYELCSVISRFFYQYITSIREIDHAFKLRNFIYDKEAHGFKLITVPLIIWKEILLISENFSYDKGDSEWHVFYKKSNYSIAIENYDDKNKKIKFFAKLKAIKEYDSDIFDLNSNVLIVWEYPKFDMEYKNVEKIWDLEVCYQWMIDKLLPFAIQHGKARFSPRFKFSKFLFKKKNYTYFHYWDENGYSDFIKYNKSEQLIDKCLVNNHDVLKILVNQMHYFFSIRAGSSQLKIDYSKQQSIFFADALILSFEYTNTYDVHYLNSKLFNNDTPGCKTKEEFITSLENTKTIILNDGLLEYKLRAFKALLEDSKVPIPKSKIKEIREKVEWIYIIIENHLLIERFVDLHEW